MISVILASALTSVVVGAIFFYFAGHDQGRRLYSLECDLEDLKARVLSEIKKRAVGEMWEKKKSDKKLDEMLETVKPPEPAAPAFWWMPHTKQSVKP